MDTLRRVLLLGMVLATASLTTGCALLFSFPPEATSTRERLASLQGMARPPFDGAVTIYWDKWQIPFIDADTDRDAALALGIVHAHLRLSQMELGKRVAQGRISEMIGPFGEDIDRALRALDIGKATPAIVADLPAATRQWLQAYTDGVNHYKRNLARPPHVMVVAAIDNDEPWTIEDSLLLGRLGSADVNWFSLFSLLEQRSKETWPALWQRYRAHQQQGEPSFKVGSSDPPASQPVKHANKTDITATLASLLEPFMRAGSNSFALSAERSASGGALIANDPHLGFTLPNLWLIAGLRSPSYHLVGMMPVGVPIMALGRNKDIAWGGTNMRQWSSDLVDVSVDVPMTEQAHVIERRFLWDSDATNRLSPYGPVLSDVGVLPFPDDKAFAIRWMGHLESDEVSAMLGVMSATTWQELREGLKRYAVPGQNLIFADKSGTIGQLVVAWFPKRKTSYPKDLWVDPSTSDASWSTILNSDDLPYIIDPEHGVIASSNNRPTDKPPTRLGWNFPQNDRIRRLYQLLAEKKTWNLLDLLEVQSDSYSASNRRLRDLALTLVDTQRLSVSARAVVRALKAWDGFYRIDSKEAYVYQAWLIAFADAFYDAIGRKDEELFWWRTTFLAEQMSLDIRSQYKRDRKKIQDIMLGALEQSFPYLSDDKRWGDIHRVAVGHILQRIPLLGARYRWDDEPISGGVETIFKSSGSPLTIDEHASSFGSQSRHLSDLSDINANYFVLFGGQDGVLNSANFMDQLPLWAQGKVIQVPLAIAPIRKQAIYTMTWAGRNRP
ncbi:MAG: penicillin acylase family protein [Alphaproteobacteria bacterium GM202ARS2]|nr:penicillin acylase family protein [Alphaproteobacteria bacterium GM202ARS2]